MAKAPELLVVDLSICLDCPHFKIGWDEAVRVPHAGTEIYRCMGDDVELLEDIPEGCLHEEAQRGWRVAQRLMEA